MTLQSALSLINNDNLFDPVLTFRKFETETWGITSPNHYRHLDAIDIVSLKDLNKFKADLNSPDEETIEKWIEDILPMALEEHQWTLAGK